MFKRFAVSLLLVFSAVLFAAPIDWDKAEDVQTGIKYAHFDVSEPRLMKIFFLRVDLETSGLYFTATEADPEIGKPMPDYPDLKIITKRITTGEFMKNQRKAGNHLVAAVNASPWVPWTKPFNHKYSRPTGLQISGGQVINDEGYNSVFVVYKDGTLEITNKVPKEKYKDVQIALSGFSLILKDGKKTSVGGYERDLHPRTAFGLSADKHYLYLMVIDGRRKDWSIGADGNDIAEWMLNAGAADAINMDGGGSATICYWDEKEESPVLLNRQTAKGYQRPVASNLGICVEKSWYQKFFDSVTGIFETENEKKEKAE